VQVIQPGVDTDDTFAYTKENVMEKQGTSAVDTLLNVFRGREGTPVEIPVTQFVRNLVEGVDTVSQTPFPRTLALLSPLEPISLPYASFFGPGTAMPPVLKLIVTRGPRGNLP